MSDSTPTLQALRVARVHDDAVLPSRAHDSDAGLDLCCIEHVFLAPGDRQTVGTGIAVEIPEGWVGLVCPRSGLASRHGITLVNAPGVIDAGYRGELRVVMHNTDVNKAVRLQPGDRIAQLVVVPCMLGAVDECEELAPATRGNAGFGSTGGFGGDAA